MLKEALAVRYQDLSRIAEALDAATKKTYEYFKGTILLPEDFFE